MAKRYLLKMCLGASLMLLSWTFVTFEVNLTSPMSSVITQYFIHADKDQGKQKNISDTTPFSTTFSTLVTSLTSEAAMTPWSGCPSQDASPGSIILTTIPDGRLGNLVTEYMSVLSTAQRYGLYPAVPARMIHNLSQVFEPPFTVTSLEVVSVRCNMPALLKDAESAATAGSPRDLQRRVEEVEGPMVLHLPAYVITTEALVAGWRHVRDEMRLKRELKDQAQMQLHGARQELQRRWRDRNPNITDEPDLSGMEFVGVHVRRTDYKDHMSNVLPGAKTADLAFFEGAMQWMRDKLKASPVAFLVVSDDLEWCRDKFSDAIDVVIAGTGDQSSPGHDLALLAACNHTIFAYGSFGLTAAMLALGRYTLLYDTQNLTHTKEMEFVRFLPGWHLLDDKGVSPRDESPLFQLTYVITEMLH